MLKAKITVSHFLRVARILKIKGLHGEVLVSSEIGASFLSLTDVPLYVTPALLQLECLRLEDCADEGAGLVAVLFEGHEDRTSVQDLPGHDLVVDLRLVSEERREELLYATEHADDDEDDFPEEGFELITDEGERLGRITELLITGANDVWTVETEKWGDVLIPVIDEVVLDINEDTRSVRVHLLDGLLPDLK
jgi:16S rRNA processing protein RimM